MDPLSGLSKDTLLEFMRALDEEVDRSTAAEFFVRCVAQELLTRIPCNGGFISNFIEVIHTAVDDARTHSIESE